MTKASSLRCSARAEVVGRGVKRPAAAIGVLKRPAATDSVALDATGLPDMTDCFEQLRAEFGTLKRNTFTCRAYNVAERRCRQAGITGKKMIDFRKSQYDAAKALFDELSGA